MALVDTMIVCDFGDSYEQLISKPRKFVYGLKISNLDPDRAQILRHTCITKNEDFFIIILLIKRFK